VTRGSAPPKVDRFEKSQARVRSQNVSGRLNLADLPTQREQNSRWRPYKGKPRPPCRCGSCRGVTECASDFHWWATMDAVYPVAGRRGEGRRLVASCRPGTATGRLPPHLPASRPQRQMITIWPMWLSKAWPDPAQGRGRCRRRATQNPALPVTEPAPAARSAPSRPPPCLTSHPHS